MKNEINENPALSKTSVSKSVLLTGKCLEDFKKWFFEYYNKDKISVAMFNHEAMFNNFQIVVKNAYLTEWFDSVGFHIKTNAYMGGGQVVFYPSFIYRDKKYNENERNVLFDNGELYYSLTREEAIIEAIKKANVFYNEIFV